MKFYVVEIADGDAKIKGKGIYEYDALNNAKASFHKKLGTAMASNLYTEDLVMVIDSNGGIYASEHYVADVVAEVSEV